MSAAATTIGVAFSTVQKFVRTGDLVLDPERDAFGARYVTRSSVEALAASRRGCNRPGPSGFVDARTVAEITGLNQRQLSDLALRGVLVRCDIGRRFHLTTESVQRWATGLGSELQARLEAVQQAGLPKQRIVELHERRTRNRGGPRPAGDVASSDRPPEPSEESHRVG